MAGPSHSNSNVNGNMKAWYATPSDNTPMNGNGVASSSSSFAEPSTSSSDARSALLHSIKRAKISAEMTMYPDSTIRREEFVRLVLQSLRDVGYRCVHSFRVL